MIYLKKFSGVWHSAVLRTLPLSGSLNRRICGSLTLAQICLRQTSHIPRTLYAIDFGTLHRKEKSYLSG